eukprot:TRINITY_DN11656_c0_g1_i2.p2 TRINITY_DN11656_c0_g1~~TRINITY_DN11656_c0_g1_i2.p2  ORF type:complete len:128 (-),score=34.58 TRINITY_DN11656_c0_g1_i2:247-630(-)
MGEVRVLRAGHDMLHFTSLKLNKMGPIKNGLNWKKTNKMTAEFFLEFRIGNRTIVTTPFKLASSCSQLPREVRKQVRPMKGHLQDGASPDELHTSPPPLSRQNFSLQYDGREKSSLSSESSMTFLKS